MRKLRVWSASLVSCLSGLVLASEALAGTVVGRLELPAAPPRPPVAAKGFLDRTVNPLANVRPLAMPPHLVVVLDGGTPPQSPPQVTWDLVGESFARPVVIAPVGAEVVITNRSRIPRTLVALEDATLVPSGPINPTGPKSFRPSAPGVYTITDKDAPHLRGTLVVVSSAHVSTVEASGKFEIADVPEGSYKVRVFVGLLGKEGWIDRPEDAVTVPAKGKAEVSIKIPPGYPVAGAKK